MAHELLGDIAEQTQAGGSMPPQFTSSIMVTTPKNDILADELIARSSASTRRPIALMQRCSREDGRVAATRFRARAAYRRVCFGVRRRMCSRKLACRARRRWHSFRFRTGLSEPSWLFMVLVAMGVSAGLTKITKAMYIRRHQQGGYDKGVR